MTAVVLVAREVKVARGKFVEIVLPIPPIGGKCWLLAEKGQFLLERGAGMLVTANCTHAGSGTLEIFDGVPDEDTGRFTSRTLTIREYGTIAVPGEESTREDKWHSVRNGRPLKRDNPVVMGAWMCNAGFFHGLTVRHYGGQISVPGVVSIVWMPHRRA